jgi:hypothetical protein
MAVRCTAQEGSVIVHQPTAELGKPYLAFSYPQAKGIDHVNSEISPIRQTREAGDSFCPLDSADG